MAKTEYLSLFRKNFDEIQAALGKSPCDIYLRGVNEGQGYRTIPSLVVSLDIRNSCRFLAETGDLDYILRANREMLCLTQVSSYFKLLGDGGLFILEPAELAVHRETLFEYLVTLVQVFREDADRAGFDIGYGCSVTWGELHKYELYGETACLLYRDYLGYALNYSHRLTSVAEKHEILLGRGVDKVLDLDALCARYDLGLGPLNLPPGSLKGMNEDDHRVQVLRFED